MGFLVYLLRVKRPRAKNMALYIWNFHVDNHPLFSTTVDLIASQMYRFLLHFSCSCPSNIYLRDFQILQRNILYFIFTSKSTKFFKKGRLSSMIWWILFFNFLITSSHLLNNLLDFSGSFIWKESEIHFYSVPSLAPFLFTRNTKTLTIIFLLELKFSSTEKLTSAYPRLLNLGLYQLFADFGML